MILVSAGHHPYRKGASFDGFYEHDEAAIWASIIVNILGSEAMVVPAGLLHDKVKFINEFGAEGMAVEIHFNSAKDVSGNRVGRGSETLYYPGNRVGRKYAEVVQRHLSSVFKPDRGAKEGWYQMNRDKGPDFFLAKTKCTALIIEPEFIHHKEEIIQKRDGGCKAIASALFQINNGEA